MERQLERIEAKLDKIQNEIVLAQVSNERRITALETRQKGIISIFSALWLGLSAWILAKLGIK